MTCKTLPRLKRLREALSYDPETGEFTWRIARGGQYAGVKAGADHDKGYRTITLDGDCHLAHRLAWLWMTGKVPPSQVDHRDLDKANNRWGNLRLATNSENHANRGAQANNTSGYKGVSWAKRDRKWDARIKVRGRQICLGSFATAVEAYDAYVAAAKEHHGDFARVA